MIIIIPNWLVIIMLAYIIFDIASSIWVLVLRMRVRKKRKEFKNMLADKVLKKAIDLNNKTASKVNKQNIN